MDDRAIQFRVGVVVVAATSVTVILIMLFGAWPNLLQPRYKVHVQFPEAPSVTVDTPVRKSGVLIGRVSDVKLLDEGGVLVSANVYDKYKLRRSEMVRIASGTLLGDAVLEFVPMGSEEKLARFDANNDGVLDPQEQQLMNELIGDGDYLTEGVVASNPLRMLVDLEDDIEATLRSIQIAGSEVGSLASDVRRTFGTNDGRIDNLVAKAHQSLDQFERTMASVQTVVGDPQLNSDLRAALEGVPVLVSDTRVTLESARNTFADFQRVSEKAEANLDNLSGFTDSIRQRGPQVVENIERTSENLNQVMVQLVTFTESLNTGQGSLGRLVRDDDLYERINRIAENAEDITRRIQPILDDVRVFTDKIARDPRQLGVRGALERNMGGVKNANAAPWFDSTPH